jgi:hypothetical protein
MEKNVSCVEKMKERENIISEVNFIETKVHETNRKICEIELEIENFKMKNLKKEIENHKKKIEKHVKEKTEFENMIKDLYENYVLKGIPVPENEGYEEEEEEEEEEEDVE